jgi:hypothetical protein
MLHVLDIVTYTAFVCGLIALPFFVVNFLRYRSKVLADRSVGPWWLKGRFPIKSVGGFAASIIVAMTTAQFSQQIAHGDVLEELHALPHDCSVSIAGHSAENPQRMVEVLQSLRWASAHHSSPSHPIFVRIGCPPHDLVLNLSRDSSDPHEYWVFFPRYRVTSVNEIGRVFTDVLDGY